MGRETFFNDDGKLEIMYIEIMVGVTISESTESHICKRYDQFCGKPKLAEMWLLEQMRKPGYTGYSIAGAGMTFNQALSQISKKKV